VRKLRFAILLPVIQVAIAIILLRLAGPPGFSYPPTLLICWGVNAPAKLLAAAVSSLETGMGWELPGFPSIDVVDPIFFLGIIVVWFLVGFALDRRNSLRQQTEINIFDFPLHGSLAALGGLFLYLAMLDFAEPSASNMGAHRFTHATLVLLWSASLIWLGGRKLLQDVRLRRPR